MQADGTENTVITDQVARPFPAAIAGTDAEWVFDGKVFRLDWQAAGVTELRWPARLGTPHLRGAGGCAQVSGQRIEVEAQGPAWVEVEGEN